MFVQSSASFPSSSAIRASTPAIWLSRSSSSDGARFAGRGFAALSGSLALRLRLLGRWASRSARAPGRPSRRRTSAARRPRRPRSGPARRRAAHDRARRAGSVPGNASSAASSASRRLDVEVVRRLVEHEEVRPRGDEQREREPPSLPAGERGHGPLVRLPPGEEEPPEERLGARPREPGRGGGRVEHRAARRELQRVLREVAGHDAVPDARSSRARRGCPSKIAASSVVLPAPFGPTSPTFSPRSTTIVAPSRSRLSPAESAMSSASRTMRPLRGGSRKSKPSERRFFVSDATSCRAAERSFSSRAIWVSFACACFAFDFL